MAYLFIYTGVKAPLAGRVRPRHLDEYVGQSHLLGAGKPLRICVESGNLHSMILWGPPGVGKTSFARLLADTAQAHFETISAVQAGVKEIRVAAEKAKNRRELDRKSTRLNSSHVRISYAVFCLKKKKAQSGAALHGEGLPRSAGRRVVRVPSPSYRGGGRRTDRCSDHVSRILVSWLVQLAARCR